MVKKQTLEAIPLSKAYNNRHSIMIISLLVFVMTLVLGTIGSFEIRVSSMKRQLNNNFTVEIPHTGNAPANKDMTEQIITYLKTIEGIDLVQQVDQNHLLNITKPWLGNVTHLEDIHLPIMIEVRIKEGQTLNVSDILEHIREHNPDANLEFHNQWEGLFTNLQSTISSTAYGLVTCLAIAILFVVMSLTRGLIFSQKETVITLQLMGATHTYIAKQLDRHMVKICLISSAIGILLAIPALIFIKYFIFSIGLTFPNYFDLQSIAPIAAIPALLALLTVTATHLTISQSLRKIYA